MAADINEPGPDRFRLMTAFKDAMQLLKNFPRKTAGLGREFEDAIASLAHARETMEKHENMKGYSVYLFFDHYEMSEEQSTRLMRALVENRVATCRRFLAADLDMLEALLADKEGQPSLSFPLALHALHYAYNDLPLLSSVLAQEEETTGV